MFTLSSFSRLTISVEDGHGRRRIDGLLGQLAGGDALLAADAGGSALALDGAHRGQPRHRGGRDRALLRAGGAAADAPVARPGPPPAAGPRGAAGHGARRHPRLDALPGAGPVRRPLDPARRRSPRLVGLVAAADLAGHPAVRAAGVGPVPAGTGRRTHWLPRSPAPAVAAPRGGP